ncbi:hypothetical protein B0H15DRAFT_1017788 [Mycena belliarum]|uniref:Uncharacterized protein n=1 Tax=Mycena belliarum TaxID=1033014 RepID=A0AAD6UM25_9AGAR|nr:hypothetical protein B0H15DRAFT_1017788 [Mycena belliae]
MTWHLSQGGAVDPKSLGSPVMLMVAFVLVQTLQGITQAGFKDPAHPSRHEPAPTSLVVVELAKCVVTFLLHRGSCAGRPAHKIALEPRYTALPLDEALPLNARRPFDLNAELADGPSRARPPLLRPIKQLYIALAPISCLLVLRHQLTLSRRVYAARAAVDMVDALAILLVVVQTYLFNGTTTPLRHCTSAVLQIAAFTGVITIRKVPHYSVPTYIFLLLTSSVSALVLVAIPFMYHTLRDVPFHKLNLVLFTSCIAGYTLCAILPLPYPTVVSPVIPETGLRDFLAATSILALRGAGELLALAILHRTSAFTMAALILLVASITPALSHLVFWSAIPVLAPQYIASIIAIYAAVAYLLDAHGAPTETRAPAPAVPLRRGLIRLGALFLPLFACVALNPLHPLPPHHPTQVTPGARMPHQHPPLPVNGTTASTCVRRALPPSSRYERPDGAARPAFGAFDDVLLVVFFSHPRYDINLDAHREVYAPYFPNILYIGPESREDRGFLHSYDVALDSYLAAEDFNADWFQMSGRMAHHMFYTAAKDHPCYAGYLWAPFDALLNVPRLMQFPQDRVWYHSPFAQRFIPNPAQPAATTPAHAAASTLRPPAARVAERTPAEYARQAAAWGADGFWWWGERHMGLEVCMGAYSHIAAPQRARFEALSGGAAHLIGGSADTVYLPGHLRMPFLDVLGTFLQTDCFLEIALPTALHLIVPEDEGIVWVDHWWKTPPPWNTTYVRDLWAEGYEVDSFHTFHWGDIQDDGFFGPNKNSVEDMRALLRDSFARQGIESPLK